MANRFQWLLPSSKRLAGFELEGVSGTYGRLCLLKNGYCIHIWREDVSIPMLDTFIDKYEADVKMGRCIDPPYSGEFRAKMARTRRMF